MFLLCCCIVLGFDVSVCFCCVVVLYWVFQQHNKNIQKRQNPIQYNSTTKTYRNAKTQYITTTQQKHTETPRPNTIQQHNKNIQKRQDPIQYNNTTKTYRNVKTQYNTTTQQKHTETPRPNTIQQHNKNIQKRQDPIQNKVLAFLYVLVVLLYCIGS
jgi:DNA mismatch repair ATPase MutL